MTHNFSDDELNYLDPAKGKEQPGTEQSPSTPSPMMTKRKSTPRPRQKQLLPMPKKSATM